MLTEESKLAFDYLKRVITSEPIMLHYPDWDLPFEIHTDASKEGVAAILCQRTADNKEKVLMYASKSLNDMEKKYHTYEQEALAVVWAVELFRKYIRNRRTLVLTDCSALQWLKTRDEGARVMRWVVRLGEFDLDIQHRRGKNSANVDGLTRFLPFIPKTHGEEIESLYDSHGEMRIAPPVSVVTRSKRKAQPEPDPEVSEESEEDEPLPAPSAPKESKTAEGKEVKGEPDEPEMDEKHVEDDEEEGEPRGFFGVPDREATSRHDFIKAQRDITSKFMEHVRSRLGVIKQGIKYVVENDQQSDKKESLARSLCPSA